MANPTVTSRLRGLILSATELNTLTGLPSAFIEDYLTIIENTFLLAGTIDGDIDTVEEVIIAVNENIQKLESITAQLNKNRSSINTNRSSIIKTNLRSDDLEQLLYIR